MSVLSWAARAAEALAAFIARALSVVAALAVAGIVAVLVFSSVQRYVLTSPIPAAEEIAAYLFVTVAFLAIMEGMIAGRQIRVLPVWHRLPLKLQGWTMIAGHVLSIGVLAILIRETFAFAWASYGYGARSYVANLLEWPWMMIIPLALSMLALALLARLLVDLEHVLKGEPVSEANDPGSEEIA